MIRTLTLVSVICLGVVFELKFMTSRKLLLVMDSTRRLVRHPAIKEGVLVDVGVELEASTSAVFWHIPKTGGTTVQDLAAWCLGIPTASEVGITVDRNDTLRLVSNENWEKAKFVNVDTTTIAGMDRAQEMGFTKSGLARIIFTGEIPHASHVLLDPNHKGMLFAVFRHPAERAVSLFYYLQDAKWEPTFASQFKNMTLMEYSESHAERDWMVRTLLGKGDGTITDYDLFQAKSIVSKKMWVGLTMEIEESIDRFGAVFGWNSLPDWAQCTDKKILHASNSHHHPKLDPESKEWEMLLKRNVYDYQLYLHAVSVFSEQRGYFFSSPEASQPIE